MKRKVLISLLAIALVGGLGCASKKAASNPLPEGAINQFDATSFRVLADAQAAINSVKADIAAGRLTPTEDEKKILNQIIDDYNGANNLYQAYHSQATSDTAGLSRAINQLVLDIAAVSSHLQGVKK